MKKYLKNLIKHPLFSGSAIMILGSNSVSVLSYLYHLILGRLLGPVNYGELASLISLIGLLGIIPGSLNLVVVKYISSANNKEEINNLIGWIKSLLTKLSFILFIIMLIASPTISSFLHIDKIIYVIIVSLSFVFSLQPLFGRAILQGLLKFKELILSILVENITKLLISIFLVYIGLSVGGVMVALLISILVGWYITNLFLSHKTNSQLSTPKNIKSMIQFSIPVFVQSVSLTSLYSADVILVKHFFPPFDAGIYASISTLGKIIFFATGPISAVMFPLISQRQARGANYKDIYLMSFLATSGLAIVVLLGYWLFPHLAIELLYGKLYLGGASLLVWYGIFMTLVTLSTLLINYGLSIGKTRIVYFCLVAAIAQIVLIGFLHSSLKEVILTSIFVTALLLVCLFIYSSYGKSVTKRDKTHFSNSPSL